MLQNNCDSVEISAAAQAFPFHYKCGFRIVPLEKEVSLEYISKLVKTWSEKSGINKEILEGAIVSRNVGTDRVILDNRTYENFRKLLYLKNNGKFIEGELPMHIEGKALEKWIKLAKSQPILLD